jgi:hypothetical protein
MCALAMVSRAGFYRSLHDWEPDLEEMELRFVDSNNRD